MIAQRLVSREEIAAAFELIRPLLFRFPAVDEDRFARKSAATTQPRDEPNPRVTPKPIRRLSTTVSGDRLPGGELIAQGLADLRAGTRSPEAFLLSRFHGRLAQVDVLLEADPLPDPDRGMYLALEERYGARAHSVHRSMTRRLVSYVHAAAHAG